MDRCATQCDASFPRPCSECGQVEVRLATIEHDAEIKHDGRMYVIHIPELQVIRCGTCGEVFFTAATDAQISQALREHLGLLSPQEIRERIARLGLMQKQLGERIGVAAETISRWLSGAYIQSRAMDKLMRLFFEREGTRLASRGESVRPNC